MSSRLIQLLAGAVLGALTAFVLVGMHRVSADIGGVSIPWGLLFGAVFMAVASILLTAWFEAKLPLGILALVFAMLALMFAGQSPGGGVLMPAQVAGQVQWTGWAVQLIGVLIPLAAAGLVWMRQIRALHRDSGHHERLNDPDDQGPAPRTASQRTASQRTTSPRTTSQ